MSVANLFGYVTIRYLEHALRRQQQRKLKYYELDQQDIDPNAECAICKDNLNSGQAIETRCAHQFHLRCLVRWLVVAPHLKCPLCNAIIAR